MTETEVCAPEEKRAALERALRSKTFARTEQLRAFLRFVCEAEIEGRADGLTESVIGVKALGRPEGYSPAEDSSVRTRAYELRQRLDKLYSTELTDEPVRIVLPKGSYAPQYLKTTLPEPAAPPKRAEITRPAGFGAIVVACCLSAVLGAAAVFWFVRYEPQSPGVDPILRAAWGPLAGPDANVLLCAATPLHLVVGPAGHESYGSPAYPAPPEAYPLFLQHRPLAPGARLGLLFTDNVLGVGTMNAVLTSARTLQALGAPYEVLPERVATISALRERNAILFGAPVDSEAISRTLEAAPLSVDYEPSIKEFVIRDRETGRMIVPKKAANGDFLDVYGLVTVLNTRYSDRGRLGMIVFSGITSAGTQGAAEFFSSPRSVNKLRAVFSREGVNGFPAAYQVVVRCTFSNWLLLAYEYNFHKILRKQ